MFLLAEGVVPSMAWLNNVKIIYKLSLIVICAIAAFGVNVYFSASGLISSQKDLVKLEEELYMMVQLAAVNTVLLKRGDELYSQAVSFGEKELKQSALKSINRLMENLDKLSRLEKDEKQKVERIQDSIRQYQQYSTGIVDFMLSGNSDFSSIQNKIRSKEDIFSKANELLDAHKVSVDRRFKATVSHAREQGETTLRLILIFGSALMVFMVIVAISVTRAISRSMLSISESLQQLAEGNGNLNHRLPDEGEDELGKVSMFFNAFMNILLHAVREVVNVSIPLGELANRLVDTTNNARNQMQEQSENAHHAGGAMEEFRSSIHEIAQSAAKASTEVKKSSEAIQEGQDIVSKTMDNSRSFADQINQAATSVTNLADDVKSVNSILDVIQSIAEQTNLLALNAAIEAARAGEQGRGFAVVADEVRSLASRTGEATKEIFSVLDKLSANASESVELMSQSQEFSVLNEKYSNATGAALSNIYSSIGSLSAINETVATATEEQSHVVEGLMEIMSTMSNNVNQCVASFSELDQVSQGLHNASESLISATNQFNLDEVRR